MASEYKKDTWFRKSVRKFLNPFLSLLMITAGLLILAYPIMLLWNFVCPSFGLPEITYWQAFTLGLLCRLLVGFQEPIG